MVKRIGRDISVEQPEITTSPAVVDGMESNNLIAMIGGTPNVLHKDHDINRHIQENDDDDENENNMEHQENNEQSMNQESDENITENDEADKSVETLISNSKRLPSYPKISTLFKKKDIQRLASQISVIDSQLPHELIKYRDAVEKKERIGDELISQVLQQNERLKSRVTQLKAKIDKIQVEDKRLHIDLKTKSLKSNDDENTVHSEKLKLNFLELLTGIKCDGITEENEKLSFIITQEGTHDLKHTYRLVIDKSDSKNITYFPTFNGDSTSVKQLLPEYLHDNITFPIETIRLFHQKVAQSLL